MEKQWVAIDVACGAENADDLAAAVAEAFETGVEITDSGVRFYLEGDCLIMERQAELEQVLDEFGNLNQTGARFAYLVSPLLQQDWADRWKAYFKPLRVGAHFLVCPTWEKPEPGAADRVIWMDPGRAFGTGHHESTRLCLEWLENHAASKEVLSSCSLLDVGTGSGILAIAGSLLGFQPVFGVDNDPEAVEVARENVAVNELASAVSLQVGSVADLTDRFDVVIANIQAMPLIEMAQDLVHLIKSGGRLVLSGILVDQKKLVAEAFQKCGLRLITTLVSGEWCLLEFQKGRKE